jgi:hypothetical protein
MVDARVPDGLYSIRGGARYDVTVIERQFEGALDATLEQTHHELGLYVGASFLEIGDIGVRVPYVWDRAELTLDGGPSPGKTGRNGWGDLELAGKVSLDLLDFGVARLVLAPYLLGSVPTGEPEVEDLWEAEYGAAATLSMLNEYLSVHGNVSGLQREHGLSAIRYRVGAAFVVWGDHNAVLRLYGYADGIEYEGQANSDINVDFGAQGLLLEFITIELGASVRVVDGGFVDDDLDDELDAIGVLDRHVDDEGTWNVQLSLGFLF